MSADDVIELNQLAYRYAAAVDACDTAAFARVFTPDGRLRAYNPDAETPFADMTGPDQLASVPDTMRGQWRHTAHVMTNHLIEIDGDTASGTLLCTASHMSTDPVAPDVLKVVIRYVDAYRRTAEGWRIADRRIRFLWSERAAVVPSGF